MSRKASNVISVIGLTALIVISSATPLWSQNVLQRKIDSFFKIASSAELKVRDQVESAKDSIAAMGVDAVPILVNKLDTQSARERLVVIQILKRIGSPAVPHLVRSLKNPDGLIVQRVCWALGDIGDSAAVDPLIGVTVHRKWQVREEALGALGDIGVSRTYDAVLAGFDDPIGQVRKAAVVAAGKIGRPQAAPPLVQMMGDQFYGARLSAIQSLLMLDTTVVVSTIAEVLETGNPIVGNLGCRVLGEIGSDPAIELLLNQTLSDNPERRSHSAVALIKADPEDNCGYRQGIIDRETDRLVRLKIESAIYLVENAQKESLK